MASQGPNNPGTVVSDSTVGVQGWDSPTAAQVNSSNDVRADLGGTVSEATTQYLKCTNFGFSIPVGATINGIVVGIERRDVGDWRPRDWNVRLHNGTDYVGDNKATATDWPTTDTYEDHGGVSDLWAASLTVAQVNGSGFGVGIAVQNMFGLMNPSIDHVRITIHYTESGGVASSPIIVVAGL